MIDVVNEVFDSVANEVRTKHIGSKVIGEYVRQPSSFPTVTLDEIRNVVVDWLEDSSSEEKYARITYRLQVFSNKKIGKKAEAREIFATADAAMRKLGFRRGAYTTTPEIYESTVYSIMAMYEAIVDANGVVYRR